MGLALPPRITPAEPGGLGGVHGGSPAAPLSLHPGRSRCAPTAVATALGPPQTLGTRCSSLFTCAAWPVALRGKRQSPPRPAVLRVGRTHRPETWLSLLPKVWGLLRARGLAFPRQDASPRKAEPVCQARGQFGSRLAAGPISSCSIPSLPRSSAKRFSVPGLWS